MSTEHSGQRVNRYPQLRPAIKEWQHLIERYCKEVKGDAPYWYTEMALVGTFAAAVWRTRGISLEEYSTMKGKRRGRGMERWSGRADIWIYPGLGKKKFPDGCVLGAKRLWRNISSRRQLRELPKKCKELLRDAKKDAKRVQEPGQPRWGLMFITPRLPKKEEKHIDDCIKKFISQLKKVDADIAWIFPARDLTYKNWIYPGVAMLIR